ncbi:MAG: maltose alpha-D-glucosyltransferase [Endomicrobiaceae bacterium]|nr:maltose alpha-D-glucosyltransferase [Endomicrobiaceae bacterium]
MKHWYKDAVIYEMHVKSFFDKNKDGIGDFKGLIEKLDYLQNLGITAIWLLPFFASPLKDDGYDILDYYAINPEYGTLRDFKKFVRECKKRNIKTIIELVVNHVSDQHFWFQDAIRNGEQSKYWNYFIWSDTQEKFKDTRVIFNDTEKSNWTWQPDVKKFYWHRFFSCQPDLDHNNPRVVRSINKIIKYWGEIGVDGFRLDAIPYLCVKEGTSNENLEETHNVIKNWRKYLDSEFENKIFLAEANKWPHDVAQYFGNDDECHMAYNFPLMPRIFISIRKENRNPITEIMENLPKIPENCQWALFLRNHDELTLEMVTDEERDYMYKEYAKDPKMRLNLGIRRRLAPLVENDRRIIEILNSILFSFPGTPIIYYGDEIGMGDNVYLGDRNGVRTPMQWSPDRNAGFSLANPNQLYLPPIMDPIYGYQSLNVENREKQPASLLNFMKKMLATRKKYKSFGRGTTEFLKPKNNKILAYIRAYEEEKILCIVNLAKTAEFFELDLSTFNGHKIVEIFGQSIFPKLEQQKYVFMMQPHSFFWFEIKKSDIDDKINLLSQSAVSATGQMQNK